jgi:eukaryotic-like serine/threonine-protein kinase
MAQAQIGKYRVLAKLGQGGMARVLLTMSQGMQGFNKLLVVKELREELAHDPEFLSMFLDEARIAARLNHPNIVQTYEVGNDGDRYFIAMEYLEGQPLNALFRRVGRRNLPLEVHLKILADVLAGLEHAHALADYDGTPFSIVHRDVSPQNIFVTYDGQVKLVDFGIAKAAGASSRTQEGMLKGKISYIAPEQSRCELVDARADIFAIGIMLWEALAGRRMITREDEMSVLARRMAGQDPSIREIVPELPEDLAAICDKAMASSREDRFQSAREFQEVLEAYLANSDYRVGAKEIGAAVSSAFQDERARIRATIEEQVKNIDRQAEPINLELVPPHLKQTSDSLARVSLPPHLSGETPAIGASAAVISNPPPAPVPQPRSVKLLGALFGGTMLGAAALGVVYLSSQRDPGRELAPVSTGEATTAAKNAEAPGSAPSPATPPKEVAESKEMIEIHVEYPQGARAKLDGGVVDGNPFVATVPKDGSIHRFEVEQDGFRTEKRTLTFDKDVKLTVELAALSASGGFSRPAKTTTPKDPDPGPPPPPTEVKKPPPSVEIDESNPYKKKK